MVNVLLQGIFLNLESLLNGKFVCMFACLLGNHFNYQYAEMAVLIINVNQHICFHLFLTLLMFILCTEIFHAKYLP